MSLSRENCDTHRPATNLPNAIFSEHTHVFEIGRQLFAMQACGNVLKTNKSLPSSMAVGSTEPEGQCLAPPLYQMGNDQGGSLLGAVGVRQTATKKLGQNLLKSLCAR